MGWTPNFPPNQLQSARVLLRELVPEQAGQIVAGIKPEGQEWADDYSLEGTIAAARMLVCAAAAGTPAPSPTTFPRRES